ncbi:MAG: helix-turn-helix domain-containing protein [Bacilli bacterium]|nr:helix-turn-helix domain-containing protein [Bacilli bacterium]
MKEIGEKLKEAREGMGVSLEEAAEDLKLKPSQIEDIESGNIEAFKDVFYLKYFIRDYSKYLGLKYEDMVNEFNEFLFDYTSKISLKDIKEAQKNGIKKEEEKTISSPYTASFSKKSCLPYIFMYVGIILVFTVTIYAIIWLFSNSKDTVDAKEGSVEAAFIWRGYEFTK